jgi:hypothetical protein
MMPTIRILTDTGKAIIIPDLTDEPMADYKRGFQDEAKVPGGTLTFHTAPDDWWVIPVSRVVAIQCLPDVSDPEDTD